MELSYQAVERQHLGQIQKLTLTPEMRLSLEMLRMPLPELREKLSEIALENPVLEYDEAGGDGTSSVAQVSRDCCAEEAFAYGFTEIFPSVADRPIRTQPDEENDDPYAVLHREKTFVDHLLGQLGEMQLSGDMYKICCYLVGDLDSRGYLDRTAEEIARASGFTPDEIKKAIGVIRSLSPAGVGAHSLQDCLTMQIQTGDEAETEAMRRIIREHLELLAENRIALIAKKLQMPVDKADACCRSIRSMNPIPSRGFSGGAATRYVVPEAVIRPDDCGELVIQTALPRIGLNADYQRLLRETTDRNAATYLWERTQQASQVIRAVGNRGDTIRRVLALLIERQHDFFRSGESALKPMRITDAARLLGLNESTVSRAISGKYLLCPQGTVSLKTFFTSKVGLVQGGSTSSASVRQTIRYIIATEDKARPLSDQSIALRLQANGVSISRRTVAKYREEMQIAPAAGRRRFGSKVEMG